ncbi:AMP-binding protein [Rhodococcus sp. IEGM 1408]|uniref:AMP-binding protein n=1 Tax=Rhodococcus sp. IEGM 1408 TaxID=3082220 RepID=UPI0029537C06|nr:AMP-binding protein [Rhodococcus sp. IEGM 1408]MDV8001953.1 AMP-binding protein [Rhodococcus sp. IEGM 1408]
MTRVSFNPGHEMQHQTFGEILLERSADDHPGLLFEDAAWTWREFVAESAVRAEILTVLAAEHSAHFSDRPERFRRLHVGVLLENVPDYLFVLCGAALAGVTVIGVNPTRRGSELASDIRGVDCDVILTDTAGRALLDAAQADGGDPGVAAVYDIDSPDWQGLLDRHAGASPALADDARDPHTLLALLFTSGSTGAPKAVMCSTGRMAMLGTINYRGLVREDVAYSAMPLFHGNALFAAFAPAAYIGCSFAMRRKFSASGFLPDVLRFDATYVNYVGRSLSYILAQPERPEESRTRLRIVFGTEASTHDRAEFARRFGVEPLESYGSSEGGVVISHTEDTPPGALGVAGAHMQVTILDDSGRECPTAEFDADGGLVNAGEAIGEICNLTGAAMFEGYYRNPAATAERNIGEVYHSGDLGYQDADGFFYFAGRSGDKIRVDSENFSAGPVERILDRFPGVLVVAVYPVPDPRTGDQVMAAIQLEPGATFDPVEFGQFCRSQPDMGTKWTPRFVRIMETMPVTATRKIAKPSLRRQSWIEPGQVYARGGAALVGGKDDDEFLPLTIEVRDELLANYRLHGRQPAGV